MYVCIFGCAGSWLLPVGSLWCGVQAARGLSLVWSLVGLGVKPVSCTLAGGFLTNH